MQDIVRESTSVVLWDTSWGDYEKNNFDIIYSSIVIIPLSHGYTHMFQNC